MLREVASEILNGEGYSVETAGSGAAAVIARAAPPGAIVLDLFKPDLDGAAVHGELRSGERLPDVRVVASSGPRAA